MTQLAVFSLNKGGSIIACCNYLNFKKLTKDMGQWYQGLSIVVTNSSDGYQSTNPVALNILYIILKVYIIYSSIGPLYSMHDSVAT